jgi:putative ABC transport system permease protein
MDHLLRDIRLGLRTLRKAPGLTFVSILALTFGIGLTTMMFSIVYGALLRGLPYEEGDRVMAIYRSNATEEISRQNLTIHDYADIKSVQRSFSHFGAYTGGTMNVAGHDRAERYQGSWVTADLFGMTGVRPLLGRDFRPGDDVPGGPKVAVLGYAMWQERYGGDPAILGTTIRVNAIPYEVIGVMPEGFRFPDNGQLWLPMQTDPLATPRGDDGPYVNVAAKLAPGVSEDAANVELATLSARLAAEHPEANEGFVSVATPFVKAYIGPEPTQLLYTMLGAVFFVLLIACSNVANLLLDRAAHRSKEVGVRAALGATRGQIVRIFLAESFVLSVGGAVLGIILAKVGMDAFNRAIVDTEPPFFIVIDLFPPVLIFAIGVSLLSTLLAGLIPAYQASRSDIAEVLKDESRGASSLRIGKLSKALVVFEIALSCGLLVAAGLMIKSVTKANSRDTGFASTTVFTARIGFPATYTDTVAQSLFFEQLAERVAGLPGVRAASISSGLPGARQGFNGNRVMLEGVAYERDQELPETRSVQVTPGFFNTLEIPLLQGRAIDATDRAGSLPVAMVNERFARQHFPDGNELGRRVRLGGTQSTEDWRTIVGVVPEVFAGDPDDPRPPVVFVPFAQAYNAFAYISARTDGDPMALAAPVRAAVASLNPDLPIYWPMTLDAAIAEPLWFVRVFGTMFAIFGLVALFLASIGLYAVMSFAVSRRTREVGIRMALGSSPARVVRMIFSSGAWQLGIGLAIGLALSAGISSLLDVVLFDVQPLDPAVFVSVALTLAVSGSLACLIPARRATLVDPAEAMRAE